jgi:hypothetical protein
LVVSIRIALRFGATLVLLGAATVTAQPLATVSQALSAPDDTAHGSAGAGPSAAKSCAGVVPALPRIAARRAIMPGDILALRDFGGLSPFAGSAPGFALSPDGRILAIQVRQAEPGRNAYCQAILLYHLDAPDTPAGVIDTGAELAQEVITLYGLSGFPAGTPRALTPKWSPDGRWLAYHQQDQGVTRLFIARFDGKNAHPLTDASTDVHDFAWAPDGKSLAYSREVALPAARDAIVREGGQGHLYDDRFWMLATTQPYPRVAPVFEWQSISLDPASTAPPVGKEGPPEQSGVVSIVVDSATAPAYRSRLRFTGNGQDVGCSDRLCTDVMAAWWDATTRQVFFARREGFASEDTALYRWLPTKAVPERILITRDALAGCQLSGARLICGRERSLRPRDVVAIDLASGTMRSLVDPNPEWAGLTPPGVVRLRWHNAFGLEAIGDLVTPPHALAGQKFPLVIVQYDTRGFLRGGIGDEFPIQAIAAAGFAVLSISRPMDYDMAQARAGKRVDRRRSLRLRLDRRSAHSSLMAGIRVAEKAGPIDTTRSALTGLSDGASSATYALIHSQRFSLALLGTCCDGPEVFSVVGPAYAQAMARSGDPSPGSPREGGWHRVSLAMNARRICARIVVQAADREARMALASLLALRQHSVDAHMYVFPDEYHVKWQPAHRAAIYKRTLDELERWRLAPRQPCKRR